jgi:hypothetical protein
MKEGFANVTTALGAVADKEAVNTLTAAVRDLSERAARMETAVSRLQEAKRADEHTFSKRDFKVRRPGRAAGHVTSRFFTSRRSTSRSR